MVKAPKGYRHRTRKLLKKNIREKGSVPSLSLIMREYKEGEKVHIVINPSVHSGMPHRRYHGRTGIVVGKRGKAYVVKVMMGSKEKTLFVRPEHIRPAPLPQAQQA
ncbi:50S ribosomal protein L21e [Desulfurococcus mucosus]|uniref:Large ribosomal subunit protein eL21 n=1 Tax=Desulfurococcus mucosus (strain ATCC 35584 / DSM 2162 / JCM 9187 / O7/1) TaxID=765177 RepID=E8RAE2_DESM0|nr:50S ribosomal protein L21e [Desulfurococcus mucosus]ADV64352.1 LSU ribosomal protein L21E [Desulfurococcus mucosus DSM 2162]